MDDVIDVIVIAVFLVVGFLLLMSISFLDFPSPFPPMMAMMTVLSSLSLDDP